MSDKAVPTKATELKMRFEEIKQQNVITIRENLTDRGFCKNGEMYMEIVDRLLSAEPAMDQQNCSMASAEL